MKYEDIKQGLETIPEKEVSFNGGTIKIKQYLPATRKFTIIQRVLLLGGAYNGKRDYFIERVEFDVALVREYTDIDFTVLEQRGKNQQGDSFYEVYDVLERKGVIDLVVSNIPDEEYKGLIEDCRKTVEKTAEYGRSFPHFFDRIDKYIKEELPKMLDTISENLPQWVDTIANGIENLDPEKTEQVADLLQEKVFSLDPSSEYNKDNKPKEENKEQEKTEQPPSVPSKKKRGFD